MKALGLGRMTLRSVFKKPETRCYPFVQTPDIEGRRGAVSIQIEDCIFCSACQRACPADAIQVDRKASSWSINHFSCVQCGGCVDACPQDCLNMNVGVPTIGLEVEPEMFAAAEEEEAAVQA